MRRLALFIDAENISADNYPLLCDLADGCGTLVEQVAIGDFSNPAARPWTEIANCNPVRQVNQAGMGRGKNSADIALTIEVMTLVASGHFDAIGIASSDRDFTPLALHLRMRGIPVFGFGGAATALIFRRSCHRFLELKPAALPAQHSPATVSAAASPTDQQLLRLRALARRVANAQDVVGLMELGQAISKGEPTLENLLGKGRLSRILVKCGIATRIEPGKLKLIAQRPQVVR